MDDFHGDSLAKDIASVPGRMGGLGLRSAERSRKPTFLASWMDALPVLDKRLPHVARNVSAHLSRRVMPAHWFLSEVQLSFQEIIGKGGDLLPCWEDIRKGSTPPQADDGFDASEWKKGWQYYTCSIFETYFMNNVIKPLCSPSRSALLLSQSGAVGSA